MGYAGTPSGRVRDVPDLRTIRYYTTMGLLDRPAEMRGRTALYGPRHLLQLVAVKKLQARGLSLSQIQQEMTGATDAMLSVPGRRVAVPVAGDGPASSPATSTHGAGVLEGQACVDRDATSARPRESRQRGADATVLPGIPSRLAPGHPPRRECHAPAGPGAGHRSEQLAEIREAAAPLLRCLREHQLIQPTPKGEGDAQADPPAD